MKRTICMILTLALLLCLCPAVSFASGEALSLTWNQGTYYDGKINPGLVSRKSEYFANKIFGGRIISAPTVLPATAP